MSQGSGTTPECSEHQTTMAPNRNLLVMDLFSFEENELGSISGGIQVEAKNRVATH